ncbi:uncharacterized protein LOC115624129 [Scaptodrosophila lebanonensis]|uniref:Uncharacterized protein LOC115624129 n=1 Tax=Drosophila lebanonensis TaxID=7225 RepID=A0A6J2TGL1_DROLE|nr:uncharacterized protein LOC115624129 [Scaptodrosophila lebanonensis]
MGGKDISLEFSAIPKLHGKDNFWTWRILLHAYLEALGLWHANQPIESPQARYIVLSTVEGRLLEPAYDDQPCQYIFHNLEDRFGPGS